MFLGMNRFSIANYISGILLCIGLTLSVQVSWGQDAQYSQFYAAPLYLNPAMAGNQGPQMATVGGNYRVQWPGSEATFTTYSTFFDYYHEDWSSGFGAIISRDVEGYRGLSNISGGLQYAYELPISATTTVRAGMHVGGIYRTANFSGLILPINSMMTAPFLATLPQNLYQQAHNFYY